MAEEQRELRVTYKWPDGTTVYIAVPAANMYPQSLDQAGVTALRTFAGALAIIADNAEADDIDADEDTV